MGRDPSQSAGAGRFGSASVLVVAAVAAAVAFASMWIASFAEPVPRLRMPGPGTTEGFSWIRAGVSAWVWLAAGLSTPLLALLARRFPLAGGGPAEESTPHWSIGPSLHLVVVLGLAYGTSVAFHSFVVGTPLAPPTGALELFAWSLPLWVVVLVLHALEAQRRGRERALESVRLRAQLAETRLDVLAARLNPHFLFNTLQGISTLIHRRPAAADRMLGQLSDLLRHSLDRRHEPEHALAEELELLQLYVAIARQRFGERLRFELEVDDALLDAQVPTFLLQPLVENAIEHGLARHADAGRVAVSATCESDTLRLTVRDDGPGLNDVALPSNGTTREGLGLTLTRERLEELYGSTAALELLPAEPRGTLAEVRIPLHRAPRRRAPP